MNGELKVRAPALLIVACLMMPARSAAQPVVSAGTAPSAVRETASLMQPLSGALFFNQQQRARMDRVRKTGVISVDGVTEDPAPSVLNGFVMRSDGQSAIWVDGRQRFNVQSEGIRQLQPSDVGGASNLVKVISQSASLPPTASGLKRGSNKVTPRKPASKKSLHKPSPAKK